MPTTIQDWADIGQDDPVLAQWERDILALALAEPQTAESEAQP